MSGDIHTTRINYPVALRQLADQLEKGDKMRDLLREIREDIVGGVPYHRREMNVRPKDAEYTLLGEERLRQIRECLPGEGW